MKAVVYDLETGRILYELEASETQILAQAEEGVTGVAEGQGGSGAHWVTPDGVIAPRPSTGLPEAAQGVVGEPWHVDGVPDGTLLVVDTAPMGVVGPDGLALRFDQVGDYQVELRPPFPWLGAVCSVEVSA